MLLIQSLAFFGIFFTIFRKNLKIDNYLYCIKPKQDKIKSSNIVKKIKFAPGLVVRRQKMEKYKKNEFKIHQEIVGIILRFADFEGPHPSR